MVHPPIGTRQEQADWYMPGVSLPVVRASEGRLAEGPPAGCFIRPAKTGSLTPTMHSFAWQRSS